MKQQRLIRNLLSRAPASATPTQDQAVPTAARHLPRHTSKQPPEAALPQPTRPPDLRHRTSHISRTAAATPLPTAHHPAANTLLMVKTSTVASSLPTVAPPLIPRHRLAATSRSTLLPRLEDLPDNTDSSKDSTDSLRRDIIKLPSMAPRHKQDTTRREELPMASTSSLHMADNSSSTRRRLTPTASRLVVNTVNSSRSTARRRRRRSLSMAGSRKGGTGIRKGSYDVRFENNAKKNGGNTEGSFS